MRVDNGDIANAANLSFIFPSESRGPALAVPAANTTPRLKST